MLPSRFYVHDFQLKPERHKKIHKSICHNYKGFSQNQSENGKAAGNEHNYNLGSKVGKSIASRCRSVLASQSSGPGRVVLILVVSAWACSLSSATSCLPAHTLEKEGRPSFACGHGPSSAFRFVRVESPSRAFLGTAQQDTVLMPCLVQSLQ